MKQVFVPFRGNNTSSKCTMCFSDDWRKEQFNKDTFETVGQHLTHWIRLLFHYMPMNLSQSQLYRMSVKSEAVLEEDVVPGPICVEVHPQSSFCLEECPLADETLRKHI